MSDVPDELLAMAHKLNEELRRLGFEDYEIGPIASRKLVDSLRNEVRGYITVNNDLTRRLADAEANKRYGWETAREAHVGYEKDHAELLEARKRIAELEEKRARELGALIVKNVGNALATGPRKWGT